MKLLQRFGAFSSPSLSQTRRTSNMKLDIISLNSDKVQSDVKRSVENLTKFLGKSTFTKQIIAGTASGWLTGATLRYAGKGAAFVLGTSIILFEVAQHKGYTNTNWANIKDFADKHKDSVKSAGSNMSKVKGFASKHRAFTAGFVGGLLLGVAY